MKILHVTAYCSLISTGGTERYVDMLCESLKQLGATNQLLVISPKSHGELAQGVTCLYPEDRSSRAVDNFRAKCKEVIDRFKPDWIFMHTSDLYESEVVNVAREEKMPYVFFYHAPYWLCAHYDMMFCSSERCQQLFSSCKCSICMASGKSKSRIKGVINAIFGEVNRIIHPHKNSWWHSFCYELPRKESIVRNAAKVVAFTRHDADILMANGIDASRVAVIPQGISSAQISQFKENASLQRTGCLKVGYIGRASAIKGCHLLVEAISLMPSDAEMELHIYGCDDSTEYVQKLKEQARGDRRIIFHALMPSEKVMKEYGKLDVLCIPSIVFETGPLTLFEGIYSGCKVFGSNQIGQREILLKYGKLTEDNSPCAWKDVFLNCIEGLNAIRDKRQKEFFYRTMDSIAEEIMMLL